MYWTEVPDVLELRQNESSRTWRFIASISIDKQDAEVAYNESLLFEDRLFEENEQVGTYAEPRLYND